MERLRREQGPGPDDADPPSGGEESGYAAAEPWHAPVQYPWLYGWPLGTQPAYPAYGGYAYPGRR